MLDLTDGYMGPWETAKLSCGAWPLLKSLTLAKRCTECCDENVFRQFKGKWPLLESLIISHSKVDIAQVKALTEIEWPHLKTLSIEPNDDAIQALMQGNWPQLRDLSLGGSGLSDNGLQQISICTWSTLERLQLFLCEVSAMTMRGIVEAYLPVLKELSLMNVALLLLERFNGDLFTALAQGRWPLLSRLELATVNGSPGCVETLASANWPCLQTVILKVLDIALLEFLITDADVPALVAAPWPSIKHLTMVGLFEDTQVLTFCMSKWPLLESLTVHTTEKVFASLLDSVRSNWPMLKLHKYEFVCDLTNFASIW